MSVPPSLTTVVKRGETMKKRLKALRLATLQKSKSSCRIQFVKLDAVVHVARGTTRKRLRYHGMSEPVVDQAINHDLSSESEKRAKPFEALRAVKKLKESEVKVKLKEMENQGYVKKVQEPKAVTKRRGMHVKLPHKYLD